MFNRIIKKHSDLLEKSANLGYMYAQYDLAAKLYDKGLIVAQDPQKSLEWIEKAYQNGMTEIENTINALRKEISEIR